MAKFCGKCGSRLDEATGLCPKCSANELAENRNANAKIQRKEPDAVLPLKATYADSETRISSKREKKGKKIAGKLLICFLVLLLLGTGSCLTAVHMGVLPFDLEDIPDIPILTEVWKGSSKEVEVVFDCNALDTELDFQADPQILQRNDSASCPPFPTRDGYKFNGWYVDRACTKKYDFHKEVKEDITLYAGWLDLDSEEAQMTESDVDEFLYCTAHMREITEVYTDDQGYIRGDEECQAALDVVEAYVRELLEAGTVTYYNREEDKVYMEFASGITCFYYAARDDGTSSSGDTISVIAVEPFADEKQKEYEFLSEWAPVPSILAEEIKTVFPQYHHKTKTFTREDVNYNSLKDSLPGDADILLWDGHGLHINEYGSVLSTSELWQDELSKLIPYCAHKTIAIAHLPNGKDYTSITPKFVEKYISLDDALVYLSACHTGYDDRLAEAFKKVGARTIFYNKGKDKVGTAYTEAMMYLVMRYMCGMGEDGIIHTASEALGLAKQSMKSTCETRGIPYEDTSFNSYLFKNEEEKKEYIENGGTALLKNGIGYATFADARVELYGGSDPEYTICSGIKGSLYSSDHSVDIDQVLVKLVEKGKMIEGLGESEEFYFNYLSVGDYKIEIYYKGHIIKKINKVKVTRHHYTNLGKIDLSGGEHLFIDVTNMEDEFLADASVRLEAQERVYSAFLDEDSLGKLWHHIQAPKGSYQLVIEAKGYETIQERILVEESARLHYQMVPAGQVYGTVTDKATGKPLNRVSVTCTSLERDDIFETRTDSLGSFHIEKMKPGTYEVRFEKEDYQIYDKTIWIIPDESLTVECNAELSPDSLAVVLVLDSSGSMSGNSMTETKKAAMEFAGTVLRENAGVSVVTYSEGASTISDFSVNLGHLRNCIDGIQTGGGTNMEQGLQTAWQSLKARKAKKKIIILMSDGDPNRGKQGDALVSYADTIKESGTLIYTVGFFDGLKNNRASAQALMERLSSNGGHYEAGAANDLRFLFGDVADQINGQRYIYIRVACPVDVSVSYDGETLTSREDSLNTRTSFGTLVFEDQPDASGTNGDNRIKVLRLKEYTAYDVELEGNGRGRMDYTIGFMDKDGEYHDLRRFKNIKITPDTIIDTVADNSRKTVLNVDENGDGKYDLKYRASKNARAELVNDLAIVWALAGGLGSVLLVLMVVKVRKKRKNRKLNG